MGQRSHVNKKFHGKVWKKWKKRKTLEKGVCFFLFFLGIVATMPIEQLTSEPASITAGDTISWKIALPDYPATSGWVLKYKAVCASGYFALVSAADGADHVVSAAKAVTAIYTPGTYTLVKYVESDTEQVTLAELPLEVRTGLSAKTAAYDTRTGNRRILDAINLAIEGRASRTDLEYTINTGTSSRTIKSMTIEQLLVARDRYTLIVWREMNPGKLAPQIRLTVGGSRG